VHDMRMPPTLMLLVPASQRVVLHRRTCRLATADSWCHVGAPALVAGLVAALPSPNSAPAGMAPAEGLLVPPPRWRRWWRA
jgi:hypothetical protein